MQPHVEAQVLRDLGNANAKLDILLEAKKDHDKRISVVEKRQYYVSGGMSLIAVFFIPKIKALLGL